MGTIHEKRRVAVIGAGNWGTALAKHLGDVGHSVALWARRAEQAAAIQSARENQQYLPGCKLPATLTATSDMAEALRDVDVVLSVVPAQTTRETWKNARSLLPAGVPILCASKGIETDSLDLMSAVLADALPGHPTGFIAGPSFAAELGRQLPTAVVIGSTDEALAKEAQRMMSSDWLRAYVSDDVVGLEIGGALKNVVAIACGCADGLELGQNTRAAIITRGLAEISRIAVKLGGDPMTLAGLAGLGDLVLTCTGDLSRNRRVGIGIGKGRTLEAVLTEMGQVAEGVKTAKAANDLAKREGVSMPITEEVYKMLYESKPAKEVVKSLMRRGLKHEQD